MILTNFSLAAFNTLSLAGEAEYFAQYRSASELLSLLEYARVEKLNIKVLGGGE